MKADRIARSGGDGDSPGLIVPSSKELASPLLREPVSRTWTSYEMAGTRRSCSLPDARPLAFSSPANRSHLWCRPRCRQASPYSVRL